jgi:NADH-quinone oxidoreductase subunit N
MINELLEGILGSSQLILPELVLMIGILILVVIVSFDKFPKFQNLTFYYCITLLIIYGFYNASHFQELSKNTETLTGFSGMIFLDSAAVLFKNILSISVFIFLVHSRVFKYQFKGEVFIMIFCVLLGVVFLSMTTHFLLIFLSLETISIASYILVASNRKKENFEAGIKYLIFGAASTAFMLFGVSLFYGITHHLNFGEVAFREGLKINSPLITQLISFLFLGGLFFKTALAPFHSWVADVYETAPTPILSFLSFAPKAAAFLLIARFVSSSNVSLDWILIIVAVISLIIGNLSALWQTNTKRLLGFSGIAQSGFIIIGFIKSDLNDFYGSFFYILAYLPITMGSFFLVDLLFKYSKSNNLLDYSGLGQKHIFLGINALIIMVALIGLPPTVGFIAKLVIFTSIIETADGYANNLYYGLLIFGLLNAAISIYYYLKIPYFMLIKSSNKFNKVENNYLLTLLLSYFSLSILFFFFFPEYLSEVVKNIFLQGN